MTHGIRKIAFVSPHCVLEHEGTSLISYSVMSPHALPVSALGSEWTFLGTVTLSAADSGASLVVSYAGSTSQSICLMERMSTSACNTVTMSMGGWSGATQAAWLKQTSATAYDPMNDVSMRSDGLLNVSTTAYNEMEEPVQTAHGQIVAIPSGSNSATFSNLPQTPGEARNFTAYVNAPVVNQRFWEFTVSENGPDSPSFSFNGSPATPLGNVAGGNWYVLGVITLAASDTSSSITITDSKGITTEVCLVQQVSAATYTPTQQVASQTDADGGLSKLSYDVLGERTSASLPDWIPRPWVAAGSSSARYR
jgi:hypothetical protein